MKRHVMLVFLLAATRVLFAADPPPLTLGEALELFRTHNPALASARAHFEATRANELTARLRPNPVVNLVNEDFRVFNPSRLDVANAQEFTDSVSWTIERGGKRPARISSARLATTVAEHSFRDIQRQLELQLKNAFVSMLLTKAVLKLAQENLADYQRTVQANQLRLQAGDISQTDFDRIKVQEASFQSDLLNAETGLTQTRVQLQALLGMPDNPAFEISGTILPPVLTLELDDLNRRALANRPDYLTALTSINKAEADHRLAIANGATDLNLAPEYKRNGPDNTLGLTLNFPLRVFDRNQGEKMRTARELESSRFAEQAARLQVSSEVSQAFHAWRAADTRSRLYTSDYLGRARDVRERIEFSYQHGHTSLLDFLDAIRSYRDIELAAVTAEAQVWFAIHQLSAATGTEVAP